MKSINISQKSEILAGCLQCLLRYMEELLGNYAGCGILRKGSGSGA